MEHVSDILSEKGIILWEIFKNKYSLTDREHFKWVQLINAVPKVWKDWIAMKMTPVQSWIVQHYFHKSKTSRCENIDKKGDIRRTY